MSATMQYDGIIKEITDEIGNQTLARFGLNIFSLNTYEAYGASVGMTNESIRVYNQHKKNPQAFGQYFEELDSGMQNISSALFNKGEKTYTTDTLYEIQKIQNMQRSGKKVENLDAKDKAKYDFIMANYGDEVKNMDFNSPSMQNLINSDTREGNRKKLQNHTNTDTVTIKNGKIIKQEQLKVIKKTENLLKDRYLDNNDLLKMPLDDYKRHKAELEKMVKNPKDEAQKAKAQKALEMLEANNLCNRIMCENPRTTAVITQSVAASAHIAQAGASDAIVMALATLANGAIYEIKDAFYGDKNVSITTRIKRLINNVISKLKGVFVRGSGFGAIDTIMGLLGQIFQSIAGKLKHIWKELRSATKSIYNAITDYITGKVSSFKECLKTIIKGLFSATIVVAIAGMEEPLRNALSAIITPFLAVFVAPTLCIIVGSIAVVGFCKAVDFGIDTLFGVFAQAEISKKRYEEISALCEKMLPQIIADTKQLERLIKQTNYERKLKLDMSFDGYKKAVLSKNSKQGTHYLNEICKLYGSELECKAHDDMVKILKNENRTGKLKW
ncbi:hypothetical protein [Helicobacter sp. T3_23-1059]